MTVNVEPLSLSSSSTTVKSVSIHRDPIKKDCAYLWGGAAHELVWSISGLGEDLRLEGSGDFLRL